MVHEMVKGLPTTCTVGNQRLEGRIFKLPNGYPMVVRLTQSQWADYHRELMYSKISEAEFMIMAYEGTTDHVEPSDPDFHRRFQNNFSFTLEIAKGLTYEEIYGIANDNRYVGDTNSPFFRESSSPALKDL